MLRKTVTTSDKPAIEPDGAIDVHAVASLYGCSVRHVLRMADTGEIPPGFRLRNLRRWKRSVIVADIASKADASNGAKP